MRRAGNGISAVVCCHDGRRRPDVVEAVGSLRHQLAPGDDIVVVVDHNDDLLAMLADALPDVRVVSNAGIRGLSGARNTGVSVTSGAYVAFLDDDAIAEAGMLEAMRAVFEANVLVAGVAAWIEPVWLEGRPKWFPSEFLWTLGCSYEGLRPGAVRNMIGAAMAVRRTVFDAVGGFADGIGRGEARLPLGCEETEFCIRAGKAMPGMSFVLEPEATCRHKVPARRATWRYFVERCWAEGLSKAALARLSVTTVGLTVEKDYVRRTLPRAVGVGMLEVARLEVWGLARACAIVLGFGATAAAYAFGRAWALVPNRTTRVAPLPARARPAGEG